MAKLVVLALAFAALVAFATAHTTIVTTTIENPVFQKEKPCRQHLERKQFDQCRMFLVQQGQPQELVQPCCQQLEKVDEQCVCKAVKQVFQEAQKEIQEQQGQQFEPFFGSQQTHELKQVAQVLPSMCNLQPKQCRIGKITTTVTKASNPFDLPFEIPFFPPFSPRPRPPFGGSSQCSETEIQRPVGKCLRYVAQQIGFPRSLLTSVINQEPEHQPEFQPEHQPEFQPEQQPEFRPEFQPEQQPEFKPEFQPEYQPEFQPEEQPAFKPKFQPKIRPEPQPKHQPQQQRELQLCCDELSYTKKGCRCQALREVAKRVIKQQQQVGQFGVGKTESVRKVVQSLSNVCQVDIQQCNI